MENLSDLVDHSVVSAAEVRFKESAARLAAARSDLGQKQGDVAAAETLLADTLRATATGQHCDLSPPDANARLSEARAANDLSRRMLEAADQAHDEATAAQHAASGTAWLPVLRLAAQESIAAALDYEAALAAIDGAVKRKVAANEVARRATREGARLPFDGGLLEISRNHFSRKQPPQFELILRSADDERELWGVLA